MTHARRICLIVALALASGAHAEGTTGKVLGGLVAYSAPPGWVALQETDRFTLLAEDAGGYVSVAVGGAVLAPTGLAGKVPAGQYATFVDAHYMHWSEFGWRSDRAEFLDNGQPAPGYHMLRVARRCLPGQVPVALVWGGTDRFRTGETLKTVLGGLTFNWPAALTDCTPENAGAGQGAVAALPVPAAPAQPMPAAPAQPVLPPAPPAPPPTPALSEPDSFTADANGYTLYQNARYGTRISFPASYFRPDPPPGNGDGRQFTSANGAARFMVFAQYNALGLTLAQMMRDEMAARPSVSYHASGRGWYVLSGVEGAAIFYRKVTLDPSGLVQVFEIAYPATLKTQFDPVVSWMAQSFGPAPAMDLPATGQTTMPQVGQLWTPPPKSPERAALMDVARGPITAEIGQPVIFVVSVLRTDGVWAYLQAQPRRPDGGPIDWSRTRFAHEMQVGGMSDTAMVLMRKDAGGWTVIEHVMGPTDVHWIGWLDSYGLPEALFTP